MREKIKDKMKEKMKENRFVQIPVPAIAFVSVILVFMLLLASACELAKPSGRDTSETEYRKGTQGLEFYFLSNNPPDKIYTGDSLEIVVEYVNRGAYDIYGGKLYLDGYDRSIIQFDRDSITDATAEGKDRYNPEGNLYQTVTFTDTRVDLPVNLAKDVFPQTFMLTACYDYQTQASPEVCIDSDPYATGPVKKVCTVHDTSLSGGQGAPVAVTKVEDESSKDRAQYKIHISNEGKGDEGLPSNQTGRGRESGCLIP